MATFQQESHKDNQDIFDLKMEKLVSSLLDPIDAIRSQTKGDGFLESRVNAFYRMIGFPVVKNNFEYFSPGYDVNLNMDTVGTTDNKTIVQGVVGNKSFVSQQLNPREAVFKTYSKLFSEGGFNSKAVALGSLYIRSFENQFGKTDPLDFDKSQVQTINDRINELSKFYSVSSDKTALFGALKTSGLLSSTHPLKPFVVDPRIVVYPDTNIIAAPFLVDFSQLTCFAESSYKRPYIERVISVRLNNKNTVKSSVNINQIIEDIKKDKNVTDATLLKIAHNPEKELQTSDAAVFNNYFKIMRALINTLVKSIKEVMDTRKTINFQPIPDPIQGMEGTVRIQGVERDNNNQELERNILDLFSKSSLDDFAFASDFGKSEKIDEGSFVFSNIDDIVFSADKVTETSVKDQLDELNALRKNACNDAVTSLQNIEYIMGEFSGLGLIDIVAIQSALWLMDRDKLAGLIDARAYDRLLKHRPNLNVTGISRSEDVIESLKEFESKLKDVYSLIQLYFNQLYNGKAFTSS